MSNVAANDKSIILGVARLAAKIKGLMDYNGTRSIDASDLRMVLGEFNFMMHEYKELAHNGLITYTELMEIEEVIR